MKKITTLVLLLFVGTIAAQDANVFWSRGFFKPNTTVKDIKAKEAAGNSATALSSNNFDATTNAILANASTEVVGYLLSLKGNDVNKVTHDGRTYLFWAAMKGNLPLMKKLIKLGAKTDVVDDKGSSVLLFAAGGGQTNPELYDLLLANGAKITETTPKGANAILKLVGGAKDLKDLNYFLEKGLDLNHTDKDGHNAVDYAARSGNQTIIAQLVKKGVAYKDTNADGSNAILVASEGGRGPGNSLAFFKYLEGLGINPNVTDNNGVTPIHNLASRNKDNAIFNYFINKGVTTTKADAKGNTPLMNAAGRNSLEVVKFFGVKNLDAKNKDGKTALTNAVAYNNADVVTYLISKGAAIDVVDTKGNNLAYYLVNSYSKRNKKAFTEKWDLLTAKGLNMTHVQEGKNNILHLAVAKNNKDLLAKIARLSIDVNAKNANGLTPLHLAAMTTNNVDLIKYLISVGAKKDAVTEFEETVYDLASENELLNKNKIEFLK